MSTKNKAPLPELRSILVKVLGESASPFELVVAAADTISLDARVDDWFLRELKANGTDEEILSVLDTTDRCTDECARVWMEFENGKAVLSDVLAAVSAARDELARILPKKRPS